MKKRKLWAILVLSVVLSTSSVGCNTDSQETANIEQTEHTNKKTTNGNKKEADIPGKTETDEDTTSLKAEDDIPDEESTTFATEKTDTASPVVVQSAERNTSSNKGTASKTGGASKSNSSTSNGTASKPGSNSSSTTGNTSKPSSSSSSSGTTAKPSTQSAPQHTHSYTIPITQIVDVPEQGHYETKVVKEAQYAWRTFCNRCRADITDIGEDNITLHVLDCGGGYYNDYVEVSPAVTEPVWVVDSPATTRTETVGYKCSCGATK